MTIKTDGLTELSAMFEKLGNEAQNVASGALFDGAGVVADAFTGAINGISTAPFKYDKPGGQKRKPSPEEKAALLGKSGIAHFHKDADEVNTLIGITAKAGYVNIGGKQKAVRMIARAINSGTSFMEKQPFARKAKSQSQGAAKAAIVSKAEEMLEELIK